MYVMVDTSTYPPCAPVVTASQLIVTLLPSGIRVKDAGAEGISSPTKVFTVAGSPLPAVFAAYSLKVWKPSSTCASHTIAAPGKSADSSAVRVLIGVPSHSIVTEVISARTPPPAVSAGRVRRNDTEVSWAELSTVIFVTSPGALSSARENGIYRPVISPPVPRELMRVDAPDDGLIV